MRNEHAQNSFGRLYCPFCSVVCTISGFSTHDIRNNHTNNLIELLNLFAACIRVLVKSAPYLKVRYIVYFFIICDVIFRNLLDLLPEEKRS